MKKIFCSFLLLSFSWLPIWLWMRANIENINWIGCCIKRINNEMLFECHRKENWKLVSANLFPGLVKCSILNLALSDKKIGINSSYFCEQVDVFAKRAKNGVSHCLPLYQPLVTFQGHFLPNVKTTKLAASALPPPASAQILRLSRPGQYLEIPRQCQEILGRPGAILAPGIHFSGWHCPQNNLQWKCKLTWTSSLRRFLQIFPSRLCRVVTKAAAGDLTRVLNKVENSPPLTPLISAPYSKQGAASMRAPAWWGGARCTLRLEPPIIATASSQAANPAPSDVDKCGRLSLGPNYTVQPLPNYQSGNWTWEDCRCLVQK